MTRIVTSADPLPEGLALKHASILRGRNHCFHDSFHLAYIYEDVELVLGFLHSDSETHPHAWITQGGADIDPTNHEQGPRFALHHWSHEDCKRHVANSPVVKSLSGEFLREIVPPRINRAGDIVFTEIGTDGKECLGPVDVERAAGLRLKLLGMI
jgi:hypothetical protein